MKRSDVRSRRNLIAVRNVALALVGLLTIFILPLSLPSSASAAALCTASGWSLPTLLIGRFSVSGDFEPAAAAAVQQVFSPGVLASLLGRRERQLNAFLWTGDRQFSEVADLIDDAFLGGLWPGRSGDRQRNDLMEQLWEKHNCNYLLGGRISKDGNVIVITPYLLDAKTGKLSRSIASRVVDLPSVFQYPNTLASDVIKFIEAANTQPRRTHIAIGCIRIVDARTDVVSVDAEALVIGLQRQIRQDLPLSAKANVAQTTPRCPASAWPPIAPAEAAALITAEVSLDRKQLRVRPIVIMIPSVATALPVRFDLPEISRDSQSATESLGEASRLLNAFISSVTRVDGTLVDVSGLDPLPAPGSDFVSVLKAMDSRLPDERAELTALASYRRLSQVPNDALAHLSLGKILLEKGEFEEARRRLESALLSKSQLTLQSQADLYESIGGVELVAQNHTAAVQSFREAQAALRAAGPGPAEARIGRLLATTLQASGNNDEAVKVLRSQDDWEKDADTLYLLGKFAAIAGRYDEAANWLTAAILVDPKNGDTRNLLAEVYETMGRTEFSRGNYAAARRLLGLSLSFKDKIELHYLLGLALYSAGAFDDARAEFRNVIYAPADKSQIRWREAAWLTLVECYLLVGNFRAVQESGIEAATTVGGRPESLLVLRYLRLVAAVLGNEPNPVIMEQFEELKKFPTSVSAKNLDWDDSKINSMVVERKGAYASGVIKDARDILFRLKS
jgi:tetratricopeptide (TPR) repeat protein